MANVYNRAFKNKWLGQPATAAGVIPVTAGIPTPAILAYLRAVNRAAAANVAVVGLHKDAGVKVGTWTDASTLFTDATAAAQNATIDDVALETNTANDGVIFCGQNPFGAVSLDVTTASAGTVPVSSRDVAYWNGTAWTALAATSFLVDVARTLVDIPVGENIILFDPPVDWAVGGSGTNVPQTTFNLRMRRTGLPTVGPVAALARRVYIGDVYVSAVALATGGLIELFAVGEFSPANNIAAVGFATGVANDLNALQAITL